MPMRQRDLTVSSSPSAAAPSAPGAPGGTGTSTMDAGGGVIGGGCAPDVVPELPTFIVLRVPVVPVVPDVVFPTFRMCKCRHLFGL